MVHHLTSGLYHLTGVVLSLGPTQICSIVGLPVIAIKAIVDRCLLSRYKRQENQADTPVEKSRFKHLAIGKREALRQDANYAKIFGQFLVPILGVEWSVRSGTLEQGAEDIVANVLRSKPMVEEIVKDVTHRSTFPLMQACPSTSLRGDTLFALKGSKTVEVTREDGKKLDAVWVPGENADPNGPTVIIFHGNDTNLDGMTEAMKYFKSLGLNGLMVTLGGYPGSCPTIKMCEQSLNLDAYAAVRYVIQQTGLDNSKIAAYGLSLGGFPALAAGERYRGLHVIVDQSFTSGKELVKAGVVPRTLAPLSPLVTGAFQVGFPMLDQDGNRLTGLDNLAKIGKVKGSLFVIQTNSDEVMQSWKGPMGKKLLDTYLEKRSQPKNLKERTFVEIPGTHGTAFVTSPMAKQRLHAHFRTIGLVA